MAMPLMNFHRTMHRKSSSVVSILTLFATVHLVFAQTPASDCVLDIQLPLSGNGSDCTQGNWGGFLQDSCCRSVFDGYLRALGQRANQTGQIFLNSTEQAGCLASMESHKQNASDCGIEKLSWGAGGCSDYSVIDVENKLGNQLTTLGQYCRLLGSENESDKTCRACLRSWDELGAPSGNSRDLNVVEDDICQFAVLVSLTSSRIDEEKWIRALYKCLGEQSHPIDDKGGEVKKNKKGLGIIIGGLVGIIILVGIASWILFRRSIKPDFLREKATSNYLASKDSNSQQMTIKEVYSATNNLSVSNFIGQGIAGKVYKGILSNGQHIAVKHILDDDGHMETFVREVTSLSHVRHPNLVTLLGHCEGQDECFLVFELCHNGNLSEWLFGKEKKLSWRRRLQIAIDCARGLWFLHTYPDGCIVHRDIKPTNILLCTNFEAKLSDFGLSKVMNMGQSFVSSEVRGTFGYVDPEYQKNRRVNSSGDVYSFGIVLLQLLSGQRVINLDLSKPMSIDKMAKVLTRGGKITDFADPKLNGEYSIEAFELVLKLALSCTGLKQQRPSMEEVVVRLEKALDISAR
ncbi:probable LRR receptor-like serine/threonine-protein kinase At1g67720 [Diospyros lotus]|uniref:probable LRR receptor-like serine/threonine-protein kinase At1g67720 n=1 Tax=Diospyros lotus TaxID=55363 RepID=UPI00224D3BF9|nr:probable LRR receptor-like serine/threonine-protein kinase At1g67720 [Diospyros lotus]